jgi:hypothetical protein
MEDNFEYKIVNISETDSWNFYIIQKIGIFNPKLKYILCNDNEFINNPVGKEVKFFKKKEDAECCIRNLKISLYI